MISGEESHRNGVQLRRLASLLIAAALLTGSVAASAPANGGSSSQAQVAKKRCKKKKKSAYEGAVAAKRKCKKKKATLPIVTPAPLPTIPPAPASLSISPTSHDFGQLFGDSPNQTFTVSNSGGSPSGTLSSSLGGTDPGNFVIATDTCNGTTLGAGSGCTVDVHCSNAEANNVVRTATLTVAGSPGGSPFATLTCTETT